MYKKVFNKVLLLLLLINMIPLLSIYGVVGHTKPKTVELGTSQKLERKSNFWDVFIMKLTYEDKVQIYEIKNKDIATH